MSIPSLGRSVAFLLCVLAGCGDDGGGGTTCGTGTTLMNGTCVADPGVTCGSGTTLMNGACVPDTTGPTCGPGTTLSGSTCVIDETAPSPVTGLTATVNGANIDLSWTAGATSATTLVARLSNGAASAPVRGKTYVIGDTLPGGAKVIAVGSATTVSDPATLAGRYSYMAWSVNASGSYGFGREVAVTKTVPTQSGAISVDIANTAATVSTQPTLVALATSNVTFDTGTSVATVDVSITNNTAGPIFHPRLVATALSVGTFSGASGSNAAGDSFYEVAGGSVLPGQTKTVTITVGGVLATDTITTNLEVVDAGMIIAGTNAVGGAGGGGGFSIDLPSLRNEYFRGVQGTVISGGTFSPSGRYYYALSRWSTALSRIDTSNGDVTQIHVATSAGNAAGTCLFMGADGFAYIANQFGRHHGDTANSIGVSRVDLGSMTTVAATKLAPPDVGQSTLCAFRGHRMAIAYGAFVYFFDTDMMKFIDTNTTTTDIDGVDLGGTQVRRLAFSTDGATLYATSKSTAIKKVDSTFAVTAYHTAAANPMTLYVDGNNTLWWGHSAGLVSFDGTTETPVPGFTREVRTILELGTTTAKLLGGGTIYTLDLTTGAITLSGDLPLDDRNGHTASWLK